MMQKSGMLWEKIEGRAGPVDQYTVMGFKFRNANGQTGALTGKVGTGTKMSGKPTSRELETQDPYVLLPFFRRFENPRSGHSCFTSCKRPGVISAA